MDSATVQEAVFKSLFEKATDTRQLTIFDFLQDEASPLSQVHLNWDKAVEREKQNRTRFAQRSIKPEEVEQELLESDRILGSELDVEQFVRKACDRLNASLIQKKKGWYLPNIPPCLIPILGDRPRLITFSHPAPSEVEYVGRNHPLVEGLARYLLEEALENLESPTAARCGVTVTDAVTVPTSILLLRLRYLLESPKHSTLLAEECLVVGFTGSPSQPQWLSDEETRTLLQRVEPTGDLPLQRKRIAIERLLSHLPDLEAPLEQIAGARSQSLLQSHRRVRAMTQEGQVRVKPQLPMDILGVYLLQPQ